MTVAGLIAVIASGVFVAGLVTAAVLRLVLVKWCPACSGSGRERPAGGVDPCTACDGGGILRVPSAVPEAWSRDRGA